MDKLITVWCERNPITILAYRTRTARNTIRLTTRQLSEIRATIDSARDPGDLVRLMYVERVPFMVRADPTGSLLRTPYYVAEIMP